MQSPARYLKPGRSPARRSANLALLILGLACSAPAELRHTEVVPMATMHAVVILAPLTASPPPASGSARTGNTVIMICDEPAPDRITLHQVAAPNTCFPLVIRRGNGALFADADHRPGVESIA